IPPTLAVTPPITPTEEIRPTQVFTIVETPTVSLTPITFEIPPTTTQAIPTVAPAEAEPTETEPAETEPIAATPTVAGNGGGILVLPTETSTPIIAPSPTATPPLIDESALLTPTLDVSPAVTVTAEPAGEQVNPLPSPVLTSASPESLTATLESTLPQSATITATITEENQSSAQQRAAMAETSSAPTEGGDSFAGPSYIVLTATPSEAPMSIMPTFTPFPTAVAVAEGNVLGTTLQSQNLMILLLCGVFSGASGLGVLGVVTTLLYMRSRSSEERNS
ncbi:MAG: hypothetical protein KDE47_13080, partial [Caldilineaceae bacterium]|nr:hypothetical protein [Caldilineaceae bacterium]